jgi:8-oxo-dGTP pyrophosphatase MutT (NUDIX family)
MISSANNLSEDQISRRLMDGLSAPAKSPYPNGFLPSSPRPAAVLIPFLRKEDAWHILYTRRTNSLAEHSGQVAFPGGRREPDDLHAVNTALREAQEEIGLQPADVRLLGQLPEMVTITNYAVTPVVGLIPYPYEFRLERGEVSRVFTIPLAWLADPANREERLRNLPAPYEPISVIYFHPFSGETLWGVSASLTVSLLKLIIDNN